MSGNPDRDAVRLLAAQLRDLHVTGERANQLTLEVARVNNAARTEGAKNDFNNQPTDFAVTLALLAKP